MSRPSDSLLDAAPEQDAEGPDLRTLVAGGLSRSLGWVIGFTVLGALVGAAIGIAQPNEYESNAKLVLRVGARELVTSESMLGTTQDPRLSMPTVADEIEMLSDVAVYERVVRALGPQTILRPADPRRDDGPDTPFYVRPLHTLQGRYFSAVGSGHGCDGSDCGKCERKAVKTLIERTTLENEPGSNVIRVGSTASSPELAQRTVAALTDAFVERHREQYSIRSLVERNRPKLLQAKRDRDAAAIAYLDHVNRTGIDGGQATQPPPASATEISALEDKLWDAKLQLEQLRSRRESIAGRAQGQAEPITSFGPVVMVPNEQYESLLGQKLGLLAERRARPSPSPARLRELDERIAQLDEMLARMPTSVAQATEGRMLVATGEAPAAAPGSDLAVDEHGLELKIQALTARYQQKKSVADESRRENLLAEQERKDLAAKRDQAEAGYKLLQERFSTLEALGTIDVNEEANLRLLQAPTLEREKLGPERGVLVLKGVLVGLLAGCLFAVVRQKLDSRLRYPEQFERSYGVPVLGVVSRHSPLRDLSRSASWEAN